MQGSQLSVYFIAPGQVQVQAHKIPTPAPGQLLIRTHLSAISPGTEMLIFRGEFPEELALDESIASLHEKFRYPLRYGYAAVGQVIGLGVDSDPGWLNQRVFSFQPHTTHFTAWPDDLIPVPDDIPNEQAVFLPNMETAINLVMDGTPLIGEDVLVFGQGIVGLLTTALLARFPLGNLVSVDRYELRRKLSLRAGARYSFYPDDFQDQALIHQYLPRLADLSFELSGAPAALDQAIRATGFTGRIVVGSWYGQKRASLDLGGYFHRSRIRLISSQVTTVAPELSGRWDKKRRFELTWEMIRQVRPESWITHRVPIHQAPLAYQMIDDHPQDTVQVILTYGALDGN